MSLSESRILGLQIFYFQLAWHDRPKDAVTLDGTGSSDPDDDQLTYTWSQIAGPSVALNDVTLVSPSFTAPEIDEETTLTFQLAVNDGVQESEIRLWYFNGVQRT
ncbi:MAG: PKD domain-containing protein [Nitrososphaeraceae archaeon]